MTIETIEISPPQIKPRKYKRKQEQDSTQLQVQVDAQAQQDKQDAEVDRTALASTLAPLVPALYIALGKLKAVILSAAVKVPLDRVRPLVEYTEVELAQLTPPTAAVLAKYAGGVVKYVEELQLLLILVAIEEAKLRAVFNERANIRAQEAREKHPGASYSAKSEQNNHHIRPEQAVRGDGTSSSSPGWKPDGSESSAATGEARGKSTR